MKMRTIDFMQLLFLFNKDVTILAKSVTNSSDFFRHIFSLV